MAVDVMPTEDTKRMACPSHETLANYLGGWIEEEQCSLIDEHLENCKDCQSLVARVESEPDSLLDCVKSMTSSGSVEQVVEPEVKYAMSIVKQLPGSNRASRESDPPSQVLDTPEEQTIGPYQLIRSLGHGGMGSVYLARHRQLEKLVAIKILPARWLSSDIHLSRFQREIRAAGGLNHPSIVTATDAGKQDEIHYLVMEYVEGYDLSRVARLCGPLAVADACEAIRRVALGLSHAHACGIVHRDIKPSNLMLSQSGEVKILDFGLARHSLWDEASAELTTVGQLMGTLDYMAPEQAECAAAVDYRADLYSLGATLFRLLVGRPPLAAAPDLSPFSKLKLLASHDAPRVDTLREDVPKDLANVIALLLHRDPSRRPASAAHVAEELKSFAAGNDLTNLALETKQKDKANLPNETKDRQHVKIKASAERSSGRIGRGSRLVASAGFAALLFAGIFLVIETQKGQLVIESDAENVSVRLLSDGKQYHTIKVQTGVTSTKLFAGKYEIEIGGANDELLIDHESVIIRQGETVLAKIGRPQTSPPQPQETTKLTDEPVYDGEPLSVWLNRVATERSPEPLYSAFRAVKKLVGPTNAEQVRNSLMNTMATVADQTIRSGSTLTSFDYELLQIVSTSFNDNKIFYEYIVNVLKDDDDARKPRIYPHLIRFEQANATPLITYLVSDVFLSETNAETVRLAADYARNYLLLNRDAKSEINQNLATVVYANKLLPLDFWLESLPHENFFGYAEHVQRRAIEALESDSLSDELITQAAIILSELHKGIGAVQVSLSDEDKKRVAGRIANLLDQFAQQPTEIAKTVRLSRTLSKLAAPRYYSPPYLFGNIKNLDTQNPVRDNRTSATLFLPNSDSRLPVLENASLTLVLLELVESIGQHAITDTAVNRVIAATLKPALDVALQLHPNDNSTQNAVRVFAWPELTVSYQSSNPREYKMLPLEKADLLAYLVNVAGYYALSDAGKENAREVFVSQLAEIKTESFLAEYDRDGNGTLSKEEAPMVESEFQAKDLDGDELLSHDEVRNFLKAKLIPAAPQDQNDTAKSIDAKTLDNIKQIFQRYDINKNGVLDASEWQDKMVVDPGSADKNKDGKITFEEYTKWFQSRVSP